MVAAVLAVLKVLAITSSGPSQEPDRRHPREDRHLEQIPGHLAGQARRPRPRSARSARRKTCIPSFWPTLEATMPEDGQRHQGHDPEQHLHQELEADRQQVDDRLDRGLAPGPLLVADLDQADPQGERQEDELGQVVLGERLADAPRDELDQEVGRRSSGPAVGAAAPGSASAAPIPGWIRFVRVRPMTIATSVLIR